MTSYDDNYSGAIAAFWVRAFEKLPAQSRVLDLATGNGAIPKLLNDLKGMSVRIDGVDATQVAPLWHDPDKHANIRFHPEVWMEHLPYPDATFDFVCSQFGVEYAERPAAWREALRVLKPGGQLHCVIHHRESVMTRIATQEQAHCKWLLGSDGLLRAALQLAPWWLRVRRGELDPQAAVDAEAARAAFNAAQARLADRIEQGGTVDLLLQTRVQVQAILTQAKDPAQALGQYAQQLREAELRCSELVQYAMTTDEIAELGDWLQVQKADGSLSVQELRQAEGLLAWGLSLTNNRSASGSLKYVE